MSPPLRQPLAPPGPVGLRAQASAAAAVPEDTPGVVKQNYGSQGRVKDARSLHSTSKIERLRTADEAVAPNVETQWAVGLA